ncbi:hypothetical protein AVEN_93815-1 [Araneus ventricosus]|uniref:Uncharacterized protein n=1 Tax=Araneus ventricosus TaxID=182803 RepID=A0A4Y2AYA1_ARAVE|nr:hypothetical protein AVEN_93815-1 [Araneus ventricosus]
MAREKGEHSIKNGRIYESEQIINRTRGTFFPPVFEHQPRFRSIDAIPGEHHLRVKIYGPLQKDIWTPKKKELKKSNHVLGRGTSNCLICKRKRKEQKRKEKKLWGEGRGCKGRERE